MPDDARYSKAQLEQDVLDMLHFIESLSWEDDGASAAPPPLGDTHPFRPLYGAISRIKQDVDAILTEKRHAEIDLARQNMFNKLRADIWAIAADTSLSEHDLIQQVLDKVGPAIGVSRASYNTFMDDAPNTSDLRCIIEWCDAGVQSTLGSILPHRLIRHVLGKGAFLLTSETALDMVPAAFRTVTKPVIHHLIHTMNLEAVAVLPHYVNHHLKGWFTFDVCRDIQQFPELTGETEKIISEMVEIISQRIAQKHAEEALQQAYNELEQRVQERTAELRAINEQLQQEIADRKRAEQASLESERKFRSLFENAGDSIMLLDPASGRFIDCNKKAYQRLGYTKAEFLQLTPHDLHDETDPVDFRELTTRQTQGESITFETSHLCKDGSKIPVEINTSMVQYGERNVMEAFVRDISERRQMQEREKQLAVEARLRQAHRIEALGTLAGGIAHDFNNILGTMLGYTELLLHASDEESKERKYLNRIHKAGKRAAELVQQILTFSRSQEQKLRPIDIASPIKEALKMMRATIPANIEIRQHLNPPYPPIMADATQIHQVMVNLCTNAYHAMHEHGGVLDIALEHVYYDAEQEALELPNGDYLKLTVSDTGKGMAADVQEHIFDPFFTTKGVGKGTGLGLSVVHGIIKGHHGSIFLESDLGKGSKFLIFFPMTEQSHVQEKPSVIAPSPTGKGSILIVDDEADLSDLYAIALKKFGYQVTTCNDGAQALDTFRADPDAFDLVFTDQSMPRMTGLQFIQELRHIRSDIPVVLATGYSDMIAEENIAELDIRQFLMKPVEIRRLVHVVQRIFREISQTKELT